MPVNMMKPKTTTSISKEAVIAVIVIDQLEDALPLAKSLTEGGVRTIELTLRTPVALEAAAMIKKNYPAMMVGIGTVLTTEQVHAVAGIGADFAVSPGCNPKVIKEARKVELDFAPGVMTPSDIESAIGEGCKMLKFFPAETSGGLKHLKGMAAPYAHLDLQYIPLGGINMANASTYLKSPLIAAVGGSWIAKRSLIKDKSWERIRQNAEEARKMVNELHQTPNK